MDLELPAALSRGAVALGSRTAASKFRACASGANLAVRCRGGAWKA